MYYKNKKITHLEAIQILAYYKICMLFDETILETNPDIVELQFELQQDKAHYEELTTLIFEYFDYLSKTEIILYNEVLRNNNQTPLMEALAEEGRQTLVILK